MSKKRLWEMDRDEIEMMFARQAVREIADEMGIDYDTASEATMGHIICAISDAAIATRFIDTLHAAKVAGEGIGTAFWGDEEQQLDRHFNDDYEEWLIKGYGVKLPKLPKEA